jgi:O-antigen ligase
MDTAVERAPVGAAPAAEPLAQAPSRRSPVAVAVVGALLVAAVLLGDGSSDDRLFWIGTAATLVVGCWLCAAYLGFVPRPRLTGAGKGFLAAFALFVLFAALTILWSTMPDRSWAYANRGFVHLLFVVLGILLAAAVARAPSALAGTLALVLGAMVAWALAGKIAPGLFPDGGRIARLRAPVGYWNALSLLCAVAVPLALWLASGEGMRRALRLSGTLLLYCALVASLLTYSRAGVVLAAFAVVLWLVIAPGGRAVSVIALAAVLPPAAAVGVFALLQPGLVDDFQADPARSAAGWKFGLALVLGGAVVAFLFDVALRRGVAARLAAWWEDGPGRVLTARRIALGAGAVVLVAIVVVAVARGAWLRAQLDQAETAAAVTQDPSRLADLGSNNRWTWWQQAWGAFVDEPLTGTGAGTFELVNLERRENSSTTTSPHNVPLQFLSETGIGGFALLALTVVLGVVAVRQGLKRLHGTERAAGAALAVGVVAYLLHCLVDKDWDYVAVNAPVLAAVGVLAATGLAPLRRRSFLAAAAVLAVAWAGLYSLSAPWFSARLVDRTYELLGSETAEAIRLSERARGLNPYSLEAILANAAALDVAGIETQAHVAYYDGMRLQPENPQAWYELGSFEFEGMRNNAFNHLNRAYELDPYGPAGPRLDELREIFAEEKAKCQAAGTC